MEFLYRVHLSCFLLSYLLALCGEFYQLLRRRTEFTRGLLIATAFAGLMAHTAYLVARSSNSGLPPLVGSSHDWLLVLAWLGALFYLLLIVTRQPSTIALFLLPIILGLIFLATQVDNAPSESARQLASRRWGMLHAAALVIGMGAVATSTICSAMFLIQYQKLRGRNSWLHRLQLPSMEQLILLNRWMVVITVAMLTIGLVTGFILVAVGTPAAGDTFSWSEPLVIGTAFVWLVMAIALVRLLTQKEQTGRQVAWLTLIAGGFLLLTIFGLMLISGGIHSKSAAKDNGGAVESNLNDRSE